MTRRFSAEGRAAAAAAGLDRSSPTRPVNQEPRCAVSSSTDGREPVADRARDPKNRRVQVLVATLDPLFLSRRVRPLIGPASS